MQPNRAKIDQFEVIKTLGSGHHAKVKLGQFNGHLYAIKKYKKDTADLTDLQHEMGILKGLEHPNIIRLHDVRPEAIYRKRSGKEEKVLAIILEYAEGGELFQYIALCGRFEEQVARTYFHMLINSLQYLHSKGICHRDIKPENILLDKDFRLRLADFGFATFLARGRLKTLLGTEGYMAPEVNEKNYDGKEVDLFAAGIILFAMYAGHPPFQRAIAGDTYYKFIKAKSYNVFWAGHNRKKLPGFFSDNFKDLMIKMLAFKPEDRLTIEGIKNHPWYIGDVLPLNEIFTDFSKKKKLIDQIKAGNRSGNVREFTPEIFEKLRKDYQLDQKLIQKVTPGPKDLILSMKPIEFYARLKQLLTENIEEQRISHRILDEDSDEVYTVSTTPNSASVISKLTQIEVELAHNQLSEPRKARIIVEVGQDEKGRLVLRFERDEETCETLLYYKLVNFIKNSFVAYKA